MATTKSKGTRIVERILADVAAAPAVPEGPCLDDGEIIEYALELMDETARPRAEKHLETCPPCLDEVWQLIEEHHYWQEHEKTTKPGRDVLGEIEAEPAAGATPGKGSPVRPRRK